jgi:hypothetical protein
MQCLNPAAEKQGGMLIYLLVWFGLVKVSTW